MEKVRWMLFGIVGLGLFSAGYLAGRRNVGENAGGSENSTRTAHRPNRLDPPERLPERTRGEPARAEGTPPSYRKIVNMVRNKRLKIEGVRFSISLQPEDGVRKLFDVSQEQFTELQRLGHERLREMGDHLLSLATVREVSESGMVFDLPADPEFAAAGEARFVKDVGGVIGAEAAEMLRPSISDAYLEWTGSRHVLYILTRGDASGIPPGASEETRAKLAGERKYKIFVNMNEDGTLTGDSFRHERAFGSFDINQMNDKEKFFPFHILWEREMKKRR